MRIALLGWLALTPVALLVVLRSPGEAAAAAAVTGTLATVSTLLSRPLRPLIPISVVPSALAWGAAAAAVAHGVPKPWLVAAFPLAMVLATLPLRLLGAPRFVANPLARTQEGWLVAMHTARLGGDLVVTALLATASVSVVLAVTGHAASASAGFAVVAIALVLGYASLRRALRRAADGRRLRVAAVVVDGRPPPDEEITGFWPLMSPEYRDVDGTLDRYRPHVERAAREGASLVVLPEVCVHLEGAARDRWSERVTSLARELGVAIVAPYFDASTPKNTLLVADGSGVVGRYDKQHPARGLEPPRALEMEVGPHRLATGVGVSTAICVDLDHPDIARSARRAGAVLAAPSNDWFGSFARLHHRSAVWTAVIGGVPIVRATGHGISAIYDGAGRVLAQRSSEAGPVVLVADVRA